MNLDFREALRTLPDDAIFRIANSARPSARYLFATILPETSSFDFEAKSGKMKVRTIMAGLVGMDSPYPEQSAITLETFSENVAKIANSLTMPEKMIRDLYSLMQERLNRGGSTKETIAEVILNFMDKVIVQAHIDRAEWLRAQALTTGTIDWTFNQKRLQVDYGIPADNINAQRTGNDAWDGSASKFWDDVRFIRRTLKGKVRAIIAHPDSIEAIRYNTANSLATVSDGDGSIVFRKVNSDGRFTEDVADTVRLIAYGLEGEVLDLTTANTTKKVPYMPSGMLLGIGENPTGEIFNVNLGSTDDLQDALGYTHIAPTVEGNLARGRWARAYVPEGRPWSLVGEGVSNILPVIEEPAKIAIATSELS